MKFKNILLGSIVTSSILFAGGDIVPNTEETVVAPEVTQESSAWEHQLTFYSWLPTLAGTLKYQFSDGSEEESEFSAIDKLDAVFMASYEIRKDKWSFLTDVIYLGMSGGETVEDGIVTKTFEEEFTAWLISFYGGYNMIDDGSTSLDIIAGMRYFSLDIDASISFPNNPSLPTIPLSPSFELYDAVIGVKGRVDINENWYVPYLFDIGAGDTELTWQAQASIGYRFDWGDVLATYRYVHYEKDGLKLIEDFDLYGPKVGVVFHF